jgi:hypothetical protein
MLSNLIGLWKKFPLLRILRYVVFFTLGSCTTNKEIHQDITNKLLSNDRILRIEKSSTFETTKGILGKHTYNIEHSYQYKVLIDDGDYCWEVSNGEPKHILFVKDSIYIHYLKEKYIRASPKSDSSIVDVEEDYKHVILDVYEVYLDKRYFFKLFGYALWIDIPKEQYEEKRKIGQEFEIPNDNELVKN